MGDTPSMRFVLCDDDDLLRSMVESIITRLGHEVVGVVDTTPAAVALIGHARPDAVIVELALGVNTDFDVVRAAIDVGACPIAFTQDADYGRLEGYEIPPVVVIKPDLHALERAIESAAAGTSPSQPAERGDRRRRPARAASGPVPTGVGDALAFYEALNAGVDGDGLVSIELDTNHAQATGTEAVAVRLDAVMRGTDRLLASASSVRVFLPGSGQEGIDSFLHRVDDMAALPEGTRTRWLVIDGGESPADAFERLKHAPERSLPV